VRSGLPNQDAVQCTVVPGRGSAPAIAVAAVSDGHGGARHFRSQIGSSLAVSTAVAALQNFLAQHAVHDEAHPLEVRDVQELQRTLVDQWLSAVSVDLEHQPLTEQELGELEKGDGGESRTSVETVPILAYGATLLVAAATDNLILFLQLGDGEILTVSPTGETGRPLPADERLLGNQTTSLCQPEAWQEFRASWAVAPDLPALVLLSTDGYANSFRSDDDFLKIGADYLEIIREQGIATLAEELPEILKEATQQGSGDDITLAILQGELKKSAVEANGTPVKPKISSESRSALIEQLKAKHSSQHRRLDELSSRLEETRKTNRRLQVFVILLILIALGAGLYFFRGHLHFSSPSPGLKPGSNPRAKPGETAPPPPPSTAKPTEITQWRLELDNGESFTLHMGLTIANGKIVPVAKGDPKTDDFARVAVLKKKMRLINDSPYTWTVSTAAGTSEIKQSKDVVLGSEPIDIVFNKGITGKITPVANQPSKPAPSDNTELPDHSQPELN
jgi:serine/threonine protein phosphatase PrpC